MTTIYKCNVCNYRNEKSNKFSIIEDAFNYHVCKKCVQKKRV